jgi:hypothetical protein
MKTVFALTLSFLLCIVLVAPVQAGPSDTLITGDIAVSADNTGDITSIAGGAITASLLWGLAKVEGQVGSPEHTVTNVNSVVIYKGTTVHGKITLNGKNTGTLHNLGSKLNVNSIVLGQ